MGVMNYEMESATLLTMCASRPACRHGGRGDRQPHPARDPERRDHENTESKAVQIVVDAARRLL